MHDQSAVVIDIPNPIPAFRRGGTIPYPRQRQPLLTVWHDPRRHGDDCLHKTGSKWRWHVWHWRIQLPLVRDLKRWLFSRCAFCKKGFQFGYAPISTNWDSAGPRWFRGERKVYHHRCREHQRSTNTEHVM